VFETYAVTTVATMVLAAIFFRNQPYVDVLMLLPLAICGVCIVTSIIGTFFVRLGKSGNIMGALYQGLIVTGLLSLVAVWWVINQLLPGAVETSGGLLIQPMNLFWAGVVGLLVTAAIVVITEYYTGTGFRPVKSVANASVSGHGTNVIQGLAMSLEATALPALTIIVGIVAAYQLAGLFGIAIATTTMLGVAGMIVALDAFGPVTDNAGGIAEMRLDRRPRRRRQHHQGRDQGLRHRFGGSGGAGPVRSLCGGFEVLRGRGGAGQLLPRPGDGRV